MAPITFTIFITENTSKYQVIRFWESKNRPLNQYELERTVLSTADIEKALGITISKNLNLDDHGNEKIHKMLIANIQRAFMNEDMVKIITTINKT